LAAKVEAAFLNSALTSRNFALIRILRNNIRIMRNIAVLDTLFPEVRQGILSATLTRPEKWWYLSELANFLQTRPSSLQRELTALVQSGILEQRRDGRRTYFKAETRSPIFRDLRSIFEKTVGLVPTLRIMLRTFGDKIACAFVYGSVARGEERATSDVDLMVIGDLELADLFPSLGKAEKRLGREINVTNYSVDEFRKKASEGNHFLTTVLSGNLQFVKGEQRDLDAIAGK
jgi:predicted nucleotidyltransferase